MARSPASSMASALVLLGACFCGQSSHAAPIAASRNPGEDDAAFVQRVTKREVVADFAGQTQVARTFALLKNAETLIGFTKAPDPQDTDPDPADDIHMDVFLKKSDGSYIWLGNALVCEVEGGDASMRSFFYTRLGKDSNPVVGVICGWDASHHGADCASNDEVRFFRVGLNSVSAVPVEKYEKVFYRQEKHDRYSKFTCTVSNFKTAADVKKLLEDRP
jgi:hypothetical protein